MTPTRLAGAAETTPTKTIRRKTVTDLEERYLLALTRIERAAGSFCCEEHSNYRGVIADVKKFATEAIDSTPLEATR